MVDTARLSIRVDSTGASAAERELVGLERQGAKTERATDNLTRTVKLLGSAMVALGAGRAITNTVNRFADFEQQMARVGAVSRASASEMVALTATARELGATTEYSASQAGAGLEFLARAGWSAQESIAAMPAVLDLATAATMELGSAADVASNIMSAYGIAAQDASSVADILAAASARANTDVQQLGDAMSYVGPVAAALKISMGDTAAAVGALSDAGIQGSSAGTGLRRVLSSLANPTAAARREFESLGLSVDQLNPATNDLSDIIDRLAESGLDASQALTIFGDRGGPAILALVEQRSKVRELSNELRGVEGEAKRMADTIRDTLSGDLLNLASAAEEVQLALGEAFQPALRESVQAATDTVRWLGDNLDTVGTVATGLAVIIGGRLAGSAATATASFVAAQASALRYQMTLASMAGVSGTAAASQIALAGATRGASAALALVGGPAGAAFIAAAGLVYFATRTDTTVASAKALEDQLNNTAGAFDELTRAQARAERIDVAKNLQKATDELDALQRKYNEMTTRLQSRGLDPANFDNIARMEAAIEAAEGRVKTFRRGLEELDEIISGDGYYGKPEDPFAFDTPYPRATDSAPDLPTFTQSIYEDEGGDPFAFYAKEFSAIEKALRTEEEKILESYQRRRDIILANTEANSKAQQDLLERLNKEFSESVMEGFESEPSTLEAQLSRIEDEYQQRLALVEKNVTLEEELKTEIIERLTKEREERIAAIEAQHNQLRLRAASQVFDSLADLTRTFGDKQSGLYKTMFAASKVFSIAEAAVAIKTGIAKASSLAFPENLAAMGTVTAATAGLVSDIESIKLAGIAHGGLENVPKESTYLLDKGERVLSPNQNRDLTNFLRSGGGERQLKLIVINQATGPGPTEATGEMIDENTMQVVIRSLKRELSNDINNGRGIALDFERRYSMPKKGVI